MHCIDRREIHNQRGECARRIRHDAYVIRSLIEGSANRTEPAGCCKLSIYDEQHGVSELFDFLENMRRKDNGTSIVGELLKQLLEVNTLPWIGAVEWLVENQN